MADTSRNEIAEITSDDVEWNRCILLVGTNLTPSLVSTTQTGQSISSLTTRLFSREVRFIKNDRVLASLVCWLERGSLNGALP